MRTAAILPVKRFSQAKQRLGASVADPLRADLARAMVGDVLSALGRCSSIDVTIVVTNERAVAAAARYKGAIVVEDTSETGQSAAVTLGVARAIAEGFARVLCVPGDCPALEPSEIDALLAEHDAAEAAGGDGGGDPSAGGADPPAGAANRSAGSADLSASGARTVVIVPDRHGAGTNGLLLAPPDAIGPSFGPDSCARHRELARAARAECHVRQPTSLLLDIDTGEDLAVLRERLAGEHARATRTRAVLGLPANRRPRAA